MKRFRCIQAISAQQLERDLNVAYINGYTPQWTTVTSLCTDGSREGQDGIVILENVQVEARDMTDETEARVSTALRGAIAKEVTQP